MPVILSYDIYFVIVLFIYLFFPFTVDFDREWACQIEGKGTMDTG